MYGVQYNKMDKETIPQPVINHIDIVRKQLAETSLCRYGDYESYLLSILEKNKNYDPRVVVPALAVAALLQECGLPNCRDRLLLKEALIASQIPLWLSEFFLDKETIDFINYTTLVALRSISIALFKQTKYKK